jgi:hypothetical protein
MRSGLAGHEVSQLADAIEHDCQEGALLAFFLRPNALPRVPDSDGQIRSKFSHTSCRCRPSRTRPPGMRQR